jgi:hypothetical protein
MKTIRRSVFETNSSSTHSITIVSKKEYEEWGKGNLFLNENSGWSSFSVNKNKKFVTKEEAIEIITNSKYPPEEDLSKIDKEEVLDILKENEFYNSDNYFEDDYLENYEENFTTESGDQIVAFGKYGRDG